MDNLDKESTVQPAAAGLQEQFDALKHVVISIMILVLVISGTLNIYLLRQWRTVSKELAATQPQATQMLTFYQKNEEAWMNDIVAKFTEYGRTHPDFAPILAKYNLKPSPATSAAPAAPTSRPPAPAPKK
jgi:hypothetical protein